MKTIGLIGGTGWVSTMEYYRLINEFTNSRLGKAHSARCLLHSFDFEEIIRLQHKGDKDRIYRLIYDAATNLVSSGADGLALCANTMHRYAEKLQSEIDVPLIHIAEATAKAIGLARLTKVGLLGTKPTMEENFYTSILKKHNIAVVIPDESQREFIHNSIFKELINGDFREDTKAGFIEITDDLNHRGANGIILGCTEIPLLIQQEHLNMPLFNTLEIHALAIVDFTMG